jgi:cytochrome c biogenesis factor
MAVMGIVLAVATVIEKVGGRETVLRTVYHSHWFVALWVLWVVGAGSYLLFVARLYRRPAVFLLHLALWLILVGAFVTFLFGERSYIHLRIGLPQQMIVGETDGLPRSLPFPVTLVAFETIRHSHSDLPADYVSRIQIDGQLHRVATNQISTYRHYRFCQYANDPDEQGITLLVSRDPWGIGITYGAYLLLALSMLYLLGRRIGWREMLLLFITVVAVGFYISRINPMTPVLRTPFLAVHVSLIMVAYLLLLIITVGSVVACFSDKWRIPLYRWNKHLLYPAIFLLMAGIFVGAVWANVSWGRYWGWDAKETWALITLFVYAFPLHGASLSCFSRPSFFHRYCVWAFLAVLMTSLGVTFLLGGLHSYV